MTALCPTCETCAHCQAHGCIPVSGDAPVRAAHRVVCDGAPKPPKCLTCNDHGLIGGWSGGVDGGYDSQDCPDCTPPSPIPVVEAGVDARWNPIESIPKEPGRYVRVRTSNVYRWLPYKPASNEFKRGIKGRWQRFDGYGFSNDVWQDATEEAPK